MQTHLFAVGRVRDAAIHKYGRTDARHRVAVQRRRLLGGGALKGCRFGVWLRRGNDAPVNALAFLIGATHALGQLAVGVDLDEVQLRKGNEKRTAHVGETYHT